MTRAEIEALVERDRLAADLARLDARTGGPATGAAVAAIDDLRARADSVLGLWGETASPPLATERPLDYRRRMLAAVQRHAPRWQNKDLSRTHGDALGFAEEMIYADARAAAYDPATVPAGTMRAVRERDAAGRLVTKWIGREPVWMDVFLSPGARGTVNKNAGAE